MRETKLLPPLLLAAALLTACTSGPEDVADMNPPRDAKLVAYGSCDTALAELRAAVTPYVGPYGFGLTGDALMRGPEGTADSAPMSKEAAGAAAADHSTTNVQEAGIDEPDLVKTDGKRVLAIKDWSLRVIDAATHTLVKDIPLSTPDTANAAPTGMLLSGDRVLVFARTGGNVIYDGPSKDGFGYNGTTVVSVDLVSGTVTGSYAFEGGEVDARQYGTTARLVVSSQPYLRFPEPLKSPSESAARNRALVASSTIEDWLPRYHVTAADGTVVKGRVDCSSMRHAFSYSAMSMLTVLTFDMTAPLGDGAPVTIVADGQTVYGSPSALYVANDRRSLPTATPAEGTEIYRFDVSQPGPPVYASSGTVPGYVLNQYSMSEFEGYLRVAATKDPVNWDSGKKSQSGVYVLKQDGTSLVTVGAVEGLGKGERIYGVRYVGATAYVVTFRQTDPLYVVDLSVPAAPKVSGELKITGYSAYLHPVGPGRLIGVGQEATTGGQRTGAQVSLFDVSNPAAPAKLDGYVVEGAYSDVEYDPHAFLYWEPARLLVVPMGPGWRFDGADAQGGALLLRVDDGKLTKVGVVRHESADLYGGTITRSLVIGETLWTYSAAGIEVTDLTGATKIAWIAA
ncbi:hypothetical protein Afil01_52860 [Actinorhabdospora filicis]|uniref:Beta propeller domain-containing protein n=1 Tax=Actinorhabdospora filicis TaxID=1785913 RepID=A0A9W6WBB7_9ACTN|nr:beta-propeller domain-containing protein [Actinorhabdospora filicis]GLZ80479.1 hypothetical protein Afil01_52860 [Actinorhabdospora filicis]